MSSSIAAIVSGILADNAKAAGEPGLATHLIGAAGDVLSAIYSQELYEIAKLVRASPALTTAFNSGTSGLNDRLKLMPEATEFNKQFAAFDDPDAILTEQFLEGDPYPMVTVHGLRGGF